ncbi:phytanoyl-CoA dioxygenase PhyH [Kribbella amoyensis]|uniref:Phytanoyl-CoA dioxygenase PhyH n=1 Tax=Kribbella amoyensis TaxID=996641 RepID=A0A561B8Y1_9ACTN|nr:phytanoyl-CoA dioxygenase family protein [Kribbella amoyensis]TWD75218.1 phytanoyl-CoA dioxygenase PhyH [Kribbella amoyensis]
MNTATQLSTALPTSDLDADGRVPEDLVAAYRQDGFVRVRGVLTADEVSRYVDRAAGYLEEHRADRLQRDRIFSQLVNVWEHDPILRELTLHPGTARVAEQLAGFGLRIWHDQMLVKEPRSNAATHFHQDRPYWPHANDRLPLSAWIALVDVPPERGCMTFLPGTQTRTDLQPQDLSDEEDLFGRAPELRWSERVTVPLRAGDCTFHSGFTGHMALPNTTDKARFAHVNIYMDEDTLFSGGPHVVTDPLGLTAGDPLDGDQFPRPAQLDRR